MHSRRPLLAALTTAALAAGALAGFTGLGTAGAAAGGDATAAAASTGGVKIAYYDQWSVYGNAFYPKHLDTRGIADKLDVINYSFGNIHPTDLTCFEANKAAGDDNNPNAGDGAGDSYADYQKSFAAADSVDGVADTWNQPIVGVFNQFKELKAKHPKLKINISIGGWTYSKYFHDAAKTDASRKNLVASCVKQYIAGDLPVDGGYGGEGAAAGIFDGIDIDWEYPGSEGGHLGNHYGAEDKANFTLLLAEFRKQLDEYGAAHGGKKYLLTAALPAGQDKIKNIETDKIGAYLDYANIMTYDMHGAWDADGPAYHQSPLYSPASDPTDVIAPGTQKYSIDNAIDSWLDGNAAYGIAGGFPANKLTLGYEFYYRGWKGVPAGAKNGLAQSATGASGARPVSQQAGIAHYKELGGIVDNAATTFWDDEAKAAYFYKDGEFFTGLDKRAIQARADYAHNRGLAGAMMYSLLGLDEQTTLLNQIVTAVGGSAAPDPTPSPSDPTPTPGNPTPSPGNPTPSPSAPPAGCTAPAWSPAPAYTGSTQVSHNGHVWKAKWWTQGEEPGTTGEWGVWQDLGAC
ncbi:MULTISPECIES: glycosyl hydrolase family 18 protein [unclassified Streptomyces]|uniref:glycosyl hydrolase family 18 protein n=1 Tax=unclassified Streptomyces TaxID=2593676 RepID=UPI002DD81A73|nr:glycosyl hydrolase family 18 protein [Streptomyces sp. NBC_01750]WSB02653.1 glycosyl hydrolase family 18 protein [Streptomyces sp. NBC_01794]WSD33074.1 glycosyl hydrolase family 18 protein [Streptomyces sp. NBC_01750]